MNRYLLPEEDGMEKCPVWSVWISPVMGSQAAYMCCVRLVVSVKLGKGLGLVICVCCAGTMRFGRWFGGGEINLFAVCLVDWMLARLACRWPFIVAS